MLGVLYCIFPNRTTDGVFLSQTKTFNTVLGTLNRLGYRVYMMIIISSRITHDDISSKLYVIIYLAEVYTVRFVFLPEVRAGLVELRKKWPTTDMFRSDLTLSSAVTNTKPC